MRLPFRLRLPTRIPIRVPTPQPGHKWLAAAVIGVFGSVLALGFRHTPGLSTPLDRLDKVLYDSMYRSRAPEDRTGADVVIIAIDDKSLDAVSRGLVNGNLWGWPWPRIVYGDVAQYLERCGARAAVFDMIFSEISNWNRDGDDEEFAGKIGAVTRMPVIFATVVSPDGQPGRFAPPLEPLPTFGAANIAERQDVIRLYQTDVRGTPSLARRAVAAYREREAGGAPETGVAATPGGSGAVVRALEPGAARAARAPAALSDAASPDASFLLHYYGPHEFPDGRRTFRFVSAGHVIAEALGADVPDLDPSVFRDKVVLIGGNTAGLFDHKASPLYERTPGVEVHATAVQNLIDGRFVRPLGPLSAAALTVACSILAAAGVALPRQVSMKLLAAVTTAAALFLSAFLMFKGRTITWLPLAAPLVALILSTIAAFSWSYLVEDRQRRAIFKALSQAVSPAVAEAIARDLSLVDPKRREMTVMFSDVAGFTDLSETMEAEQLAALMRFYLEEMSGVVLSSDGTLDKYIGDAIMSFWNAPLDQAEHAVLACRTALGMRDREIQLQPELRRMGASKFLTRIGINTGPMAVGNMGSSKKFSYTVLGDSVNFGARLEPANKLYGSQILMAQSTADLVKGRFVARRLDVLRVKGKQKPMAVYELMAEGDGDDVLRYQVERYDAAFGLYQAQKWDEAEAVLEELLHHVPDDGPAAALRARVQKLHKEPPPPGWDGVYVAKEK